MELKRYNEFITEVKRQKIKGMKYIEMTGSPRESGFKTKAIFLDALNTSGNGDWTQAKMTKRDNIVDILVTDSLDSTTNKMKLAEELGVEIMTYDEMADVYGLL